MRNNFAHNLKYYRRLNHMSQEKLAEELNVTRQAISTYEKGIRTCSFDALIIIAELFGISIDDLLL